MILRLRVDRYAKRELFEAAARYKEFRQGLGEAFADAVQNHFDELRRDPHLGGRPPGVSTDLPIRRLLLDRFPYAIVFLRADDELRVMAIAHGKRRPGYWLRG